MKVIFSLLLVITSFYAQAECDIEPLKKEIISQYETLIPVKAGNGEIGHAKGKNFVVADYLMRVKSESFLITNFDLEIKWMKGDTQTVKTLIVATVDPATCLIDGYEQGDTLGTSMSGVKE